MHENISLIDTHAHIDGKDFLADFDPMLARAEAAGVTRIIAVGGDIESSRRACEMANNHERIFSSVGVHPHDAVRVSERSYDIIRKLAAKGLRPALLGFAAFLFIATFSLTLIKMTG